eukprot:6016662-Prymnesium_polylepis.2
MPRLSSGKQAKPRSVRMSRQSHASAMKMPAPNAWPLSAATVWQSSVRRRASTFQNASIMPKASPGCSAIQLTSRPFEKNLAPLEVTMSALGCAASSTTVSAALNASTMGGFTTLSPRSRLNVRTPLGAAVNEMPS